MTNIAVQNHTVADKIINHTVISEILTTSVSPDRSLVRDILDKACALSGLSLEDVSMLLAVNNRDLLAEVFETASKVKNEIYGKRLVLFAPLYISNYCSNACEYCAFSSNNKRIKRRALSQEEINEEVKALLSSGHKRVLLVAGESPSESNLNYICQSIETVYAAGDSDHIRRLNVNIAPLSVEGFLKLKQHRLGTYQLFQETYHESTYRKMHTSGPKSDYKFRLEAMDRAMEAGISDVGIGALLGLYDYKYEVLAMMQHAAHLESRFGAGPHTISVPRIEPADGSAVAESPPHVLSDEDFAKVIAVLRLAVPYTGIILSTRETADIRKAALDLGVSQISAGSRTNPGGYKCSDDDAGPQFQLGDHRDLDEVIRDCLVSGYLPSFCTGCYRMGRTGKDFMDLAKPGLIKEYCLPNAIVTLKEYLKDYASEDTRLIGEKALLEHLKEIPSEKRRQQTEDKLSIIESSKKRDMFF